MWKVLVNGVLQGFSELEFCHRIVPVDLQVVVVRLKTPHGLCYTLKYFSYDPKSSEVAGVKTDFTTKEMHL